jgi:predicted DCC family thiol-disulfide oxidoreductase YuxK
MLQNPPSALHDPRQPYSYRRDPAVPAFPDADPIIVFDGLCGFCSSWVRFVLKHDHAMRYRFIAAQSDLGRALYRHYGLDSDNFETNILIDSGHAYFKADGSIRMFIGMGAPWSWMGLLRLFPTSILDGVYDIIARNRLRLMGRRETCFIPNAEFKNRFLS